MASHPKGPGTQNVQVNLLDIERDVFARIAIGEDRSLGHTIRRLAIAGLRIHNPDAADRLEAARREHREQTLFTFEP